MSNHTHSLFTLLLAYSLTNGKPANPGLQVIGGQVADAGEYPWVVSIQHRWSGTHLCGGSIIDYSWILTAAHCLEDVSATTLQVRAGSTDLSTLVGTEQIIRVSNIYPHPDYESYPMIDDIGLVQLISPLSYTNYVTSAAMPESGEEFSGDDCTVCGWGATQAEEDGSADSESTSPLLQDVTIPVWTDEECQEIYGDNVDEDVMCAGYATGGKDACEGDSGGPMTCNTDSSNNVLAGIVSWGDGCAQPAKPGVYTKVSHYLGWISDTISANS